MDINDYDGSDACCLLILSISAMTELEAKEVKHRRTRFVCISDTHNSFPGAGFKLPPGDVLIHAGDLTNQGSYAELEKTVKWMEEADFEVKIVIAGEF